MEIKKLLFRKEMKLVTLLLTSLLIATASAAVYYSLSMKSTISTVANDVYFVLGTDNAGVSISSDKKSATLASLKAYANMTLSYDDPIKVRNNNTGTDLNVRLRSVSMPSNVNASYFVFINFTLQTSTKISLNYTSNGSSWSVTTSPTAFVTVNANTEYSIVVQTKASETATSGQKANIEIAIDVEQ